MTSKRSIRFNLSYLLIPCFILCLQSGCKTSQPANQPGNAELQALQGTWEGIMVDADPNQKITINITGTTLHFHRDLEFWFETTITLPAGKAPKQLHATIRQCPESQEDIIGEVVRAFYKIEEGTFTLAPLGEETEETHEEFASAGTRYELRKIQ